MSALSLCLLLVHAALGGATLSGQIVDQQGAPLAQAQVFIEPGIGGALQQVQTDAQGRFSFNDILPGAVGLFAIAEGYGFNGQHVNVLIEDQIAPITIRLSPAGTLSGKVENQRNKPVEGARITRAVLLNEKKVGIPLSKLSAYGFSSVKTDSKGRFVLDSFAAGEKIALKVLHKDYAQTGTDALKVGGKTVEIKLYPGIIAQGTVSSTTGAINTENTLLLIQNAQPPHNTAVVRPDAQGSFAIRLNPGTYLCRVQSGIARSPGWKRWEISQDSAPAPLSLTLSGVSVIQGSVNNAITGEPLAGVSVSLRSSGNLSGRTKTGPTGAFRFEAGAGESVVTVDPLPGYFPPRSPSVLLELTDGELYELPGTWMKPIPDYPLEVLDIEGVMPVQNASVRLLQPPQMGAVTTDATGKTLLRIGLAPKGNMLIGLAEDTEKPLGALFAFSAHSKEKEHAVQLLEYATVHGTLITDDDKPASGVMIAVLMQPGEEMDAVPVWRSVTQPDGAFTWYTALPGIPFTIVAFEGTEAKAFSTAFQLNAGEEKTLMPIQSSALRPGTSRIGKRLEWYKYPVLSGEVPGRNQRNDSCWLVVYAPQESLLPVSESLYAYQEKIPGLRAVLVVDASISPEDASIPVLKGSSPGRGTSYLVNQEGKVIWETFGLPALHELRIRIQ